MSKQELLEHVELCGSLWFALHAEDVDCIDERVLPFVVRCASLSPVGGRVWYFGHAERVAGGCTAAAGVRKSCCTKSADCRL